MLRPNRSGRVWPSLACFLLLLFANSTAAYGKDHRASEGCTAAKARHLSIVEASRNRRALERACVRVTGIIDGSTLYQDLSDIYRDTRAWREHDPNLRMVARIGLRPFPEKVELRPHALGLVRISVIGHLHDCARDWGSGKVENGEILIRMGSGWCHYNGGAVLTPIAIVAQDSIAATRKTGRRAWQQFGDIAPLKKGSTLAVEAMVFLDHLFDAVGRMDKRLVLDLHGYGLIKLAPDESQVAADELGSVAGSDAQHMLDLWFGNSGSILSQVRLNAEHPNVRLFEPRWKMDDWPEMWACWGSGPLADDDWPISSLDATNVIGRPYACINLVKKRLSVGSSDAVEEVWVAQTFGGPSALDEPSN